MLYLGIGLGYLLLNLVLAWVLTQKAFFPGTCSYKDTLQSEVQKKGITADFFSSLPKEEFETESSYGYKLHGIWVPEAGSRKIAVIVHGHTYTLMGSLKYVDLFRTRGYNILIYDQPYHGMSGGSYCTLGYNEKDDLSRMIDWAQQKIQDTYGQSASFVLTHGESMGAATVLLHAGEDRRVDAVIADCPFRSLRAEFAHQLITYYRLPGFLLLPMASLIIRFRLGFFLSGVSPEKAVDRIAAPVFFIHGTADRYIPMQHSIRMYNRKADKKRLFLMPEAGHAASITTDPKRYEAEIEGFLREWG